MLAGRRVGLGAGAIGDTGSVAEGPDVLVSLDALRLADPHAAALVEREPELGEVGVRGHAGRPDKCAGQDPGAVGEACGVRLDGFERCVDVDFDSATREPFRGVVAEPARNLRQDLRRRVDEYPALLGSPQLGIVAHGVADEVGELAERFDARVAGSDEDEGQLAKAMRIGGRGCRRLEPAQDVVAQVDRVGQRLEAEGVLGEAGDRQRA